MNRPRRIQSLIKVACRVGSGESDWTPADERIVSDASTVMRQACTDHQRSTRICIWRTIMKTRTARFTTAAAVVAAIAITCWDKGSSPVWAVEETVAAIEQIETMQIKGTALWGPDAEPESVSFDFWIQSPQGDSEPVKMRFECDRRIVVVRGNVAYECWPKENVAKVQNGPALRDLKYWYKAAELTPWLTGRMLKTMQQFADDWTQTSETDPATGKKQIVVTCSYPPSNTSFFIVVDPESKLIQRARLWQNLRREGRPAVDARTFVYNQKLPDELFQLPPGMTIVNQREQDESRALFDRGENLFHNENQYAEAIEIYRQVYDKYPDQNVAATALMMIGLCHHRLGQHEEEIEAYERSVREHSHLKGWIESTYFYLGHAYMKQGQQDKALEAFENCLRAGQGVRKPDQFPLKEARQCIERIKSGSEALFDRGENLFHSEKKYAEALKIYQQVYDTYPDQNVAATALMMIGLCHRRLGQRDKEIAAYEKAVSEYAHLKGWIEATYFYLGHAYMERGQKEEALEAFENCLRAGQGVRRPDQFPLQEARQCIDQIKGQ